MKPHIVNLSCLTHPSASTPSLAVALVLAFSVPVFAQGPINGFPIDWSDSHVIYLPSAYYQNPQNVAKDPRFLRRLYAKQREATSGALLSSEVHGDKKGPPPPPPGRPFHVDWAVSLGTSNVAQNMSPAKYSFVTNGTPSCSDWVVFGLNIAGSTTTGSSQANLIAVNNLYGTANGCSSSPKVMFAYATAGPIATSPVISFNDSGAQVAFVDNESGRATLRIVKYSTATGNGTAAAAPVAYPGTGTEVHLQYSSMTNTNSSLYVDYTHDAAYVGDDGGNLYKISPVFGGGTPAQIWKATLAGTLTGPVLDQIHGVVLVGSGNGNLYSQNASNGGTAATALSVGNGSTYGIIADPPVIVTGTTTYAFVTTDCNAVATNGVLLEAEVTASALTNLASPTIGDAHGCGSNNLHAPALDDTVYNGSSGYLYVCGTVIRTTSGPGGTEAPVLYSYSFNPSNGSLGSSATSSTTPTANAASECSPLTYFTSSSTSRLFAGIGYASGGTVNSWSVSSGSFSSSTQDTAPSGLGGTSAIVVDNSSSTTGLANIYFSGLSAGNVSGTSGNCQSFSVSGSRSGTTVTLTGTGFNFSSGGTVVVSGFSNTALNGTWALTNATSTSLTYSTTTSGAIATESGTASWGTCGFQLSQATLN